jgi:hydroxymethylbilane synthase
VSARLRLGTRGSALALWQAGHVKARLEALGQTVELVVIKTKGDQIQDRPLAAVGGKGLFVTEIEVALAASKIDLAVHSMKDLPGDLAEGLVLGAVPERADPRDALISASGAGLDDLPDGARVGTSSLRRACQLRARRKTLKIEPLRGNVNTRLRKLDAGELDAVVLAAAGLERLGFAGRITQVLATEVSLPAVGQGALAIEVRAVDEAVRAICGELSHEPTERAVAAERALLARLQGGCQVPIAGYATFDAGTVALEGLVGAPDGSEILRDRVGGAAWSAEDLGRQLAERLLAKGAERILGR